jgi:hypothetical protein
MSQGAIFFASYEFFKRVFCLDVSQPNVQRIPQPKHRRWYIIKITNTVSIIIFIILLLVIIKTAESTFMMIWEIHTQDFLFGYGIHNFVPKLMGWKRNEEIQVFSLFERTPGTPLIGTFFSPLKLLTRKEGFRNLIVSLKCNKTWISLSLGNIDNFL